MIRNAVKGASFLALPLFLLLLLLIPPCPLRSQGRAERFTISGYVTDSLTGEVLIGAGVLHELRDGKSSGTVTNSYGYYSLTIPSGAYPPGEGITIQCSYVGYGSVAVEIEPGKDMSLNFKLLPSETLQGAQVSASKESGIKSTYLGALDVPVNHIKNVPVLFGEADVMKAIQLMPGVQGGTEGTSGLYVRGGGADENLILLDGVPIYNVDHMFGLFSVFQPEAVKKVTFYKGSFPSRYSGRISSIIDIRTNDGNMKEFGGTLGVGLISDKLHLEGPIIKDKLSFSLSGRAMNTFFYSPIILAALKGDFANYYFYDVNGKVTWRLSDKDRFYFGFYTGSDTMPASFKGKYDSQDRTDDYYSSMVGRIGVNWGNTVGSVRWNHVFSSTLFSNTTLSYNTYRMKMGIGYSEEGRSNGIPYKSDYGIDYNSGIEDYTARMDFDYTPSPAHLIKFGAEYVYHLFKPEALTALAQVVGEGTQQIDTTFNFIDSKNYGGHDFNLYVEDDISLGDYFTVNPGLHATLFRVEGKNYFSLQPRLSAKASFGRGISLKAGYSRMSQYVHLLSSAMVSMPTDLWVPITKDIKPVTSDQFSAGIYYDGIKGWEISLEAYYKMMDNLLEYKEGAVIIGSSASWSDKVLMGKGTAKGVELYVQKTQGKTTGFLSYTLAKSDRVFPDGSVNSGRPFPFKYDRRHNLNISVNHSFSETVDLNAVWSFATGGTTTLPSMQTLVMADDSDPLGFLYRADYVEGRNNYRLPPSHRLNVGLNLHLFGRKRESIWNFSVYNLYNAMNPNLVFLDYNNEYNRAEDSYSERIVLKKYTILPLIPSISYTLKF